VNYRFNFGAVFASSDLLFEGMLVTIYLSAGAMILGLLLSILCAWAKTSGVVPLRWAVDIYVEAIRNTPFLVQIFLIFFGLPMLGVRLSPNVAALFALVINVGAYATEIIRAGIESISRGQIEAARALGLNTPQVFRFVIVKPALRAIYPALTSQFIYLMLGSSVVSGISATDLTAAAGNIQSLTFASFEVYFAITIIYFVLASGFSGVFAVIGRRVFNYPLSR
jgi:polar amino acid transport system permease protein